MSRVKITIIIDDSTEDIVKEEEQHCDVLKRLM